MTRDAMTCDAKTVVRCAASSSALKISVGFESTKEPFTEIAPRVVSIRTNLERVAAEHIGKDYGTVASRGDERIKIRAACGRVAAHRHGPESGSPANRAVSL